MVIREILKEPKFLQEIKWGGFGSKKGSKKPHSISCCEVVLFFFENLGRLLKIEGRQKKSCFENFKTTFIGVIYLFGGIVKQIENLGRF